MKKHSMKKILSVVLALSLLLSCAVCGAATASAADGKVTYKYVVTSKPAAAYEGKLTYPADMLAVDSVTVYNETGLYSVSDGAILFNFTSENDMDFSDGTAVITVVFAVTGDYEKSDVNTTLNEFYSTAMAKGKENIPYNYAHVFDDEIFLSGYADIDNPQNDRIDPTTEPTTSSQELIDAISALRDKYQEAINTVFEGDYTDESLQRVWDALYGAEDILNKNTDELTVEEVLAQIEALQNALDSLEKRETTESSTTQETSGSDSGETTETTEPSSSFIPKESTDPTEEPTPSSVPKESTDPTEEPTPSSVPKDSTDPTEEPTPSSVPKESTDPTEEPTPSSVTKESTDPTEEPTPSSVPKESTDPTEESAPSSAPKESTDPTETTTTDKSLADAMTKLSDKISEAENTILEGSLDYTLDSIQRVWKAVREAKEILNSTDEVTVEEVTAQIEALQKALDALEKREPTPENPSTTPSDPTDTESPSTDSTTEPADPTEPETPSTNPTTEPTDPTESEAPTTDPTTGPANPTESETPSTAPTTKAPDSATEASTVESVAVVGPGADGKDVEKLLTKTKDDEAPDGSTFNLLQLKNTKTTKTTIKLSYKKPSGTKTFVIYGAKCGKKYKVLKTVKGKSVKIKKLKKGKYYKFIVVALNKKGKVVAASKTIHVVTNGGKYGNPNKVTIKKIKDKKLQIKQGKTLKLKTKVTAAKGVKFKTHRKVTFESANTKVATVSKNGKIKAKKNGTCYIYAYAQNGVTAKVKVTVK